MALDEVTGSSWNKITVFGNPYRGLAREGLIELDNAAPPGSVTEPVPGGQPITGSTELLERAVPPSPPLRTGQDFLDDIDNGYTWTTFSILSGQEKMVYGKDIGRFSSIYLDAAGRNWLIDWTMSNGRIDYALDTADPTITLPMNATATLVSEFGRIRSCPEDLPNPPPVNILKMDTDFDRDVTEEGTYTWSTQAPFCTASNNDMQVRPHDHYPVQQSPDGSKVMLTWTTNENPPSIRWGKSGVDFGDPAGPGGAGAGNEVIAYIVEATITGVGLDDEGTGIAIDGVVVKSWDITFNGQRVPDDPAARCPPGCGTNGLDLKTQSGTDGVSVSNTMGCSRLLESSDSVTCNGGQCNSAGDVCHGACPSGSSTSFSGSHSESFGNVDSNVASECGGGQVNSHWQGEHRYEKRSRHIASAYYDKDGVAHFIEVENTVFLEQDYQWTKASSLSESASLTITASNCDGPGPPIFTRSGSWSESVSNSSSCLEQNGLGQSIEVFFDGASAGLHTVENIFKREEVVSFTDTDSAGPGDIDFDLASFCCLDCGPPATDDIWYNGFGGSNFTRAGSNTETLTRTLKVDGVTLCENEDILVRVIDGVDDGVLTTACGISETICTGQISGCNNLGPFEVGCKAFPNQGSGGFCCISTFGHPIFSGSGSDNCIHFPPFGPCDDRSEPCQLCDGTLPRGVIIAPEISDVRTGWYLQSNRSIGFQYNLRHTNCDATPGNFEDQFYKALAESEEDNRTTLTEIRSTVHPKDLRFEVSEDDDIVWV